MYRSELINWQFGGCFSLTFMLCWRVSVVNTVPRLWILNLCPHVSRQLFSTSVLMESLGLSAPFNMSLTTFHISVPKQTTLHQYHSYVSVGVNLLQVVNALISCGHFGQTYFEVFLLGKEVLHTILHPSLAWLLTTSSQVVIFYIDTILLHQTQ